MNLEGAEGQASGKRERGTRVRGILEKVEVTVTLLLFIIIFIII